MIILRILYSFLELKKAKLNLSGKTVPELIQLARHIVTSMTGNLNFTTPNPPLALITAVIDSLETAYQESQSGEHAKKAEVREITVVLKHQLAYLEAYVTNTALGDEQKILSSGMELYKTPTPVGVLPAPADVRLENGTNEGEVTVRFEKVEHAASYNVDYYESAETLINIPENLNDIPWLHTDGSTKTKFMITGLTPGNRIIVRVAALNTEGLGTWSDPATMIVP